MGKCTRVYTKVWSSVVDVSNTSSISLSLGEAGSLCKTLIFLNMFETTHILASSLQGSPVFYLQELKLQAEHHICLAFVHVGSWDSDLGSLACIASDLILSYLIKQMCNPGWLPACVLHTSTSSAYPTCLCYYSWMVYFLYRLLL